MPSSAPTPTITWNIDADGDWSTAADWSTGELPAASDDVSIDTEHLDTISFSKVTATIKSLVVGNDDLSISSGALTITDLASFANQVSLAGGTLSISGQGATIASFQQQGGSLAGIGAITITGGANFTGTDIQSGRGTTILQGPTTINAALTPIGGRTIENQGTVTWTGGFWQPDNATFRNDPRAVLNVAGGPGINNAKGSNRFVNAGTLNVADGKSGSTVIYAPLTNIGTVSVASGTLNLSGGGTSSASAFSVAAGATLGFGIGFPYNGPVADSTFTMTGGSLNILGKINIYGGTLDLSAAKIVNLGAQGLSVGAVFGGELKLGTQNATAGSVTLNFDGIIDGTGTLTITGATTFLGGGETGAGTTLLTGHSKVISVLNLSGGRILENRTVLDLSGNTNLNDATIRNDAGATLRTHQIVASFGSTASDTVINAGTFEIDSNAVDAWVSATLVNTGTLSIGKDSLTLLGANDVLGGTITGAGSVLLGSVPGSTLMSATVGNLKIAGGATLSNGDGITQTANVTIVKGSIANGAMGSWHITDDAVLSGGGAFANQGLLEKDAGTGSSRISLAIMNSGTIESASGVLKLSGAITGTGTLLVANGARLRLEGAVGAGQTATFQGGGALVLADVAGFSGQISGFNDPGSFGGQDSIELANFAFSSSETISFKENAGKMKGTLTITDGVLHANLTLFGQYIAAGFRFASNHAGGTAITYTQPPSGQVPQLAPAHS
jgi:hypothetical protein